MPGSSAETAPFELSTARVVATYVVTSSLLAAAWHARFPHGLWVVNGVAAVAGVALARFTLGPGWCRFLGCSLRNAGIGITLGLLLVGVTQLSARLLLPYLPVVLKETQRLYGLLEDPSGVRQFAPIIWLVAFAEELVYRGVVMSFCERRMRPVWAILCSAALYVLPLAACGSWLLLIIGITLGICWTLCRVWSGSLLVSILIHGMWSCATFLEFPVA
jgi:membrane protease YdiL (CAAX protease family)